MYLPSKNLRTLRVFNSYTWRLLPYLDIIRFYYNNTGWISLLTALVTRSENEIAGTALSVWETAYEGSMHQDTLKKLTLRGGRRAGAGRKRLPDELKRQRRAMRKQITVSWNVSREWEDKKLAFGMKRDKEFLQYILRQARPVEEEDKENPLGSLRHLVTHFNDLRRENKLCDAIMQVRGPDGTSLSFMAHKLVLVMTSKYFQSLSKEDLKAKCEFFLQDVTPKGLGLLLDYMYGLKIDPAVHYSCVEEIVNAATVLQVEPYLKQARSIIKRGRKIAEMAQLMSQQLDRPMDLSVDLNLGMDGMGRLDRQARGDSVSQSPDSTQGGATALVPNLDPAKIQNPGAVFTNGASNITCSTASLLNQSGGQCTAPSGNVNTPINAQPMYFMMQGVNGIQNLVVPAGSLPQYQLPALGFLPGVQVPSGGQIGNAPLGQTTAAEVNVKVNVPDVEEADLSRSQSAILDFSKDDSQVRNYMKSENTVHHRTQTLQRYELRDPNEPIDLTKVKSEMKVKSEVEVKSEPPEDCHFGYQTPPWSGALRLNDASSAMSAISVKPMNRQISCESVVSPSAARAAASVVDLKDDFGARSDFKCDVCSERFQFKSFLENHERKTHRYRYKSSLVNKGRFLKYLQRNRKRKYSCKVCSRSFSLEGDLRRHVGLIHKYRKCRKSAKLGKNLPDRQPKNRTVSCSFCHEDFTTMRALRKHNKELHLAKSKRFRCEKCPRTFAMPESLQRHRSYRHKVKVISKATPIMTIHGRMFFPERDQRKDGQTDGSGAALSGKTNESTNSPKAKWICHLCSLVYNQRSLLMKHLQIIHNIETPNVPLVQVGDREINRPNDTSKARWTCHVCSLYFGNRWSLLHHLETMHRVEKPQVQLNYRSNQARDAKSSQAPPFSFGVNTFLDAEATIRNSAFEEVKRSSDPVQDTSAVFPTPAPCRQITTAPRGSVFPEREGVGMPVQPSPRSERLTRRSAAAANNAASSCNVCTSMATTSPVQESTLETRANIQAPAYSQMTFKLIKSKNNDPTGKNNYTLKLWPRKEMVSFGSKWSVYKCPQCRMPFRRIQCFTKHMSKVHGVPFAMAQVDTDNMAAATPRSRGSHERRSGKKEVSYNFKQYIPPDEHGNDSYTKFRKT